MNKDNKNTELDNTNKKLIMGWKSTKEISRKELEQKIEYEILYNIENLSDETLTYVLEILSDDKKSNISSGYNYSVKDE